MITKRQERLLKTTNNIITDGAYKVIDIPVFLNAFKKRDKVDESKLVEMFSDLQKRDYIDIKYSDNKVFCLAVRPKGRMHFEKETDEAKYLKKIKRMMLLFVLLSGVFSFICATIAVMIFSK